MPRLFSIFSQLNCLIQTVDINLNTEWQTVQIKISWLLQKPTDLDLHFLQRQGISGFSRPRVKISLYAVFQGDSVLYFSHYKQNLTESPLPFMLSDLEISVPFLELKEKKKKINKRPQNTKLPISKL